MSLLRHLSQRRQYVCHHCIRRQHTSARVEKHQGPGGGWVVEEGDVAARKATWAEQAGRIKAGQQKSMLSVLEERGFVKDVAGGRPSLDWLLTEKRIAAYVGVDPTAPSLHVGHLLPLMALYWMYLHGYHTVSLLGGGTVQIGDPSGRTTARAPQEHSAKALNVKIMSKQLRALSTNVRCLGIKHQYSQSIGGKQATLNNIAWLRNLNAIELMRTVGSGMRLGSMLARDSVKVRMESGEGMAISEFSYPLFQAYDWWSLYKTWDVQLQIGGSDQYGNICAGMDAVSHMRKLHEMQDAGGGEEGAAVETYGLTTPLLTTASGEKFGKSAGNAVWLDPDMMSSFDLYQYFLRTADDDVERYLKLFTFIPLQNINLLMGQQRNDESKRLAQHILAKEIVELAHGAEAAKKAETAHKEAFSHGTNTFALGAIRSAMSSIKTTETSVTKPLDAVLLDYKKAYAASSAAQAVPGTTQEQPKESSGNVVTLPLSMLQPGSFPRILHAAGLASSKSDAHRLIAKKGAYVVVPNSGSSENPTALQWISIESSATADPKHFLVDFDALVLRSGKSKIQICHIVQDEQSEGEEKAQSDASDK